VRVLGSRHSFNDIADSAELLSLAGLAPDVRVDGRTVSFAAGLTYGELAPALDGLALHNLASLPHISVAGAVATATHGSGDRNGNLATAVSGLELVTSAGELVRAARGDPDFDGLVVGLGALGAVTRVTLDVEPAYEVSQRVFEDLAWDSLYEHFDAITASGYSVSVFTRWRDAVDQVWVKSRGAAPVELFGARPATVERHPILGMDPVNTTAQLGRAGPWWDRLPHFRMGFTPSAGDELQSEYAVARADAVSAIEAVRTLADRIRPLLQVSEIRTTAADRLWMSPQYERDTVGIHFTWRTEPEPVMALLAELEAALAPFGARPHWGKLFRGEVSHLYGRRDDFVALAQRLDPRGAFRNAWLAAHVLG
jgi:xylitol oxidase